MKKVRKFVLSKREKVLWLKVHAINPDTMHKDGPTSWELAAIIHEASRKDYQYKFSEEMMSDLIVGSYKNNLNISPNKKLDKKEDLEDFIIASLEFLEDKDNLKFFDPSKKIGMQVSSNLLKEGIIGRAMPHGDILGLAPPLCLNKSEVDIIIAGLKKSIDTVYNSI